MRTLELGRYTPLTWLIGTRFPTCCAAGCCPAANVFLTALAACPGPAFDANTATNASLVFTDNPTLRSIRPALCARPCYLIATAQLHASIVGVHGEFCCCSLLADQAVALRA